MSARVPCVIVAVALLLSGCGVGDGDTVTSGEQGADGWRPQVLAGEPGPDQPVLISADGDQIVVAFASDDGRISGFSSGPDGEFSAGTPLETGLRYLGLGGLARVDGRWVALGSGGPADPDADELSFDLWAFSSADGRTWEAVDANGLDGQADVSGLTATGDGVVAVGTLRTAAQPSDGGFLPVAWRSGDGRTWQTVPLPTGGAAEGVVTGVADLGDEVLAIGRLDGEPAAWASADGGRTWAVTSRPGLEGAAILGAIVRQGDVAVISAAPTGTDLETGGPSLLLRSADGGRTWQAAADPPVQGEGFAPSLHGGGGRFFLVTYGGFDPWSDPARCYADIESCRRGPAPEVLTSDDGESWRRVDVGSAARDGQHLGGVVAGDDGRVVVLRGVEGGVGTWTWPAGVDLPAAPEPSEPKRAEIDHLEDGEVPELGRRYAVPLYVHCGMDWLHLGATPWHLVDGGWPSGGPMPEHWPVAGQTIYGYATLVSEDRVEYSIGDGEVIATYEQTGERPPGCD